MKNNYEIILLLFLFLLSTQTFAQEREITGKVIDEAGIPLPGVAVSVQGTSIGTVTDFDGEFSLSIPNEDDAILVFSYLGFENQEVPIGSETNFNITLQEDLEALDEVVVVGYGTQRKEKVTGAISSINAEEMEDMPVAQVGQRLQGKLPGVRINQTTGTPGEGISFRIRGQASINAGNAPLVVIDGFPTAGGLETISPNAIESISVLKDASATALYGSRGANGVILVTTKMGKEGQMNIDFSSYYGIQQVPERGRPDIMNARQFAQYKKEWYQDQALDVPERYQNPEEYGPNAGTNWFDVLLRDAPTQGYNLSLSSGTDKSKSFVNLNYSHQEGVMLNTYAERFTARANNLYNASDRLSFGLNLAASYRESQNFATDGYWAIINGAYLMDPTLEYRNEDGTLPVSFSSPGMFPNPNWYRVLTERENPVKQGNVVLNSFAEYEIIDGLKYKLDANVDIGNSVSRSWIPSTAQGGMFVAPPQPATGSYNTGNYRMWQIENILNYNTTINEVHNLDVFVAHSVQSNVGENSIINAREYPDDQIGWINAAATRIGTAGISQWNLLSYLGRLNYDYQGKYLLSMAFRRDGSSKFGSNKKWGNFPSVSLGWIASEENFLLDNETVTFLKFRGSWGKVGNNNIGNYSYIAGVGQANYVFNGGLVPGRALTGIGNNNLTWETTTQYDVGLDIGLLNDRIYFTYDYYWKKTDGLLYAIDIPIQSGFTSITSNIGQFNFWGHEASLQTFNLTGDFRWNTQLNVSLNRNIVKKLGTNNVPIGGYRENVDYARTEVGHPMGQFYGYIYDGVFMNQQEFEEGAHSVNSEVGSVRIRDVSGPEGVPDGIIDVNDKTFIGDPNPDFTFGITNEFYYRNFDASITMAGQYGGEIMNATMQFTENLDGVFNVRREVVERWRSIEDPGAGNIPRISSDPLHRFNNSRWVFDGSYISAKNITLGYTLPLDESNLIRKARLYFSAQNAFLITNYPGMNPEISDAGLGGLREGVDMSGYPVPRTLTLGINVSF